MAEAGHELFFWLYRYSQAVCRAKECVSRSTDGTILSDVRLVLLHFERLESSLTHLGSDENAKEPQYWTDSASQRELHDYVMDNIGGLDPEYIDPFRATPVEGILQPPCKCGTWCLPLSPEVELHYWVTLSTQWHHVRINIYVISFAQLVMMNSPRRRREHGHQGRHCSS